MTEYECNGDGNYRYDHLFIQIQDGKIALDVREDGEVCTIVIDCDEKVKEIARVLVAFLQGDDT